MRNFYHKDIRTLGSGNIGMANVWRNFGRIPGIATFLLDLLKGFIPVIIAGGIFWQNLQNYRLLNPPLPAYFLSKEFILSLTAIFAVLGHSFTPWLAFRGGKGFATALGALLAILKLWLLIPLLVFAITFFVFRFVSLGTIIATLSFLLITIFVVPLRDYLPLSVLTVALILFTHRENIRRLASGKEPRFSL